VLPLLGIKPYSFDINEAMKTGAYVSGTTGCGKSDLAMRWADDMRQHNISVMVWDPSQDWIQRYPINYKLRFPANPELNSTFRDLYKVQLKSAIFDTSRLTYLQYQILADKFCWLLFQHQANLLPEQRRPFFIIFEEAHIVLPQGSLKANRLQNVVRLLTVGRNFKIRMGVVTQFASMVDKNAMRFMKQRYFGWTDEMNDRKYISKFIGDENAEELKTFEAGQFWYYKPADNILDRMQIQPYD